MSVVNCSGGLVKTLAYETPTPNRLAAIARWKRIAIIKKTLIVALGLVAVRIVAEAIKEYRDEPRKVNESADRKIQWSKDMDQN
jgi:hypothetical protein